MFGPQTIRILVVAAAAAATLGGCKGGGSGSQVLHAARSQTASPVIDSVHPRTEANAVVGEVVRFKVQARSSGPLTYRWTVNGESQPVSADPEPVPEPAAQAMFRKTELWDKPPLFRSEVPVLRQKVPDRQVNEIHDRIDILEDRFEFAIIRLERRIKKLEERRRS